LLKIPDLLDLFCSEVACFICLAVLGELSCFFGEFWTNCGPFGSDILGDHNFYPVFRS